MPRHPGRKLQVRRTRRSGVGKFRLKKPAWTDPYPWIAGTNPEKRIFAALMDKHIYFIFQGQVPELEGTGDPAALSLRGLDNTTTIGEVESTMSVGGKTKYERWLKQTFRKRPVQLSLGLIEFIPDFVIPEYKVILDPFSPFHHSQFDSVVRDTRKVALYSALGYEYIHFWVVAPGVFVLDEDQHMIGQWKNGQYKGSHPGAKYHHERILGAVDLLDRLPPLQGPPRYPLTDQRDILAKRTTGYRIGAGLGAGANSVALANHKRKRPPKLTLKLDR